MGRYGCVRPGAWPLRDRGCAVADGKHKPEFTPHFDTGDFVVVINADKVKLTGAKMDDKVYYRHSGRPGNLKSETAR